MDLKCKCKLNRSKSAPPNHKLPRKSKVLLKHRSRPSSTLISAS
ncbi:hypothetical protein L914_11177 [Phytophthora nicotianae]|uniref:Uncharacterized protein n=1 Tax=Phytophthora nicotianae TaxID=4792 RepID=W2N461_PHYNI|nr:hypothetical protein L914_11177 [Phytophthora nicotianae]